MPAACFLAVSSTSVATSHLPSLPIINAHQTCTKCPVVTQARLPFLHALKPHQTCTNCTFAQQPASHFFMHETCNKGDNGYSGKSILLIIIPNLFLCAPSTHVGIWLKLFYQKKKGITASLRPPATSL